MFFSCHAGTAHNAANHNFPSAAIASVSKRSVPLAEHTAHLGSARCVCEGVDSKQSRAHARKVDFLFLSWKPLGGVFQHDTGPLRYETCFTFSTLFMQAVRNVVGTRGSSLYKTILCAREVLRGYHEVDVG